MRKINEKGFVLAETLVVAVFLLVIFGMLYSNFYPLIGEYEKRESYDDVDSKYALYWIKKMIEDGSYNPSSAKLSSYTTNHFMRFECKSIEAGDKQQICRTLVHEFEIDGCDSSGNNCEIFITPYKIAEFKKTVDEKRVKHYKEECSGPGCTDEYVEKCKLSYKASIPETVKEKDCRTKANKSVFDTGLEDYIAVLPNYNAISLNGATSRIIARFHHRKDSNSYYSYATIEVNR